MYSFNFNEESVAKGLIAGLGAFLVVVVLLVIAIVVFQIIAMVKVYKKAGKGGWEAIVPYYNNWVLCEIAGLKWWFFLIMNAVSICGILGLIALEPLAALASLGATFMANYNLAIKFGKDGVGYGIGLTLLPVVFYSILAFGDATYTEQKLSAYGPIPEEKVENKPADEAKKETKKSSTKNAKFCKNCGASVDGGKFCPNCGNEIH